MTDLFLIVTLAGQRVAMDSAQVESVVELEGITSVPRAAPHVAGLAALRSRVLTVIDCLASLEVGASDERPLREAVVVEMDGHPYALVVDAVEDVVEAEGAVRPLPASLKGGWRRIASGMVQAEGDLLLVIQPQALIAGPQAEAA